MQTHLSTSSCDYQSPNLLLFLPQSPVQIHMSEYLRDKLLSENLTHHFKHYWLLVPLHASLHLQISDTLQDQNYQASFCDAHPTAAQ